MTKRRPWWSELRRLAASTCWLGCGLLGAIAPPVAAVATKAASESKIESKTPSTVKKRAAAKLRRVAAPVSYAEVIDGHLHGAASFYGHGFRNRQTASGERFTVHGYTAASNRFPLGSKVEVWRTDGSRCALVQVNDRMGQHRSRVIDVSRGAAEHLQMIGPGVVRVRVVKVEGDAADPACHDGVKRD